MKEFPCYDCPDIGEDAPRCNKWKHCKRYHGWIWSKGIKGLAIFIAGLIEERQKTKRTGENRIDRVDEIRARCNHKLTGRNKYHGYIATKSSKHGEGVYDSIIERLYQCEYEDIPHLLAEIERLRKYEADHAWKTAEWLAARQKLCEAIARTEKAERERDEYKAALQNWHEPEEV